MTQPLLISALRSSSEAGISRVVAGVDGVDVWFESGDVALRPSAEAFTSAFLIPAAILERQLMVSDPVAPDFAAGSARILEIVGQWWGYSRVLPAFDSTGAAAPQHRAHQPPPARPSGTVLCFSGGVDSFYTLLAAGRSVDSIAFAHGFDIKLGDATRFAAVEAHCREVAAAVGVRPVFIRTNLREHPAYRATNWQRTHGGALAAIGHLLADQWNTLLISAAYSMSDPHPCGSHWDLDHLWSGAGLAIEHIGAERDRTEKLAVLKDNPLVQRYLRVCWENRSLQLNCSRCEKCIRNEVVLAALGALESFTVFESPATLVERIDGVAEIRTPSLFARYESALALGLPPDTAAAVRRLLARSHRALWRRRAGDARWYAAAVARRILRLGRTEAAAVERVADQSERQL